MLGALVGVALLVAVLAGLVYMFSLSSGRDAGTGKLRAARKLEKKSEIISRHSGGSVQAASSGKIRPKLNTTRDSLPDERIMITLPGNLRDSLQVEETLDETSIEMSLSGEAIDVSRDLDEPMSVVEARDDARVKKSRQVSRRGGMDLGLTDEFFRELDGLEDPSL